MLNALTNFESLLKCHLLGDISLATWCNDAGLFPVLPELIPFFIFTKHFLPSNTQGVCLGVLFAASFLPPLFFCP